MSFIDHVDNQMLNAFPELHIVTQVAGASVISSITITYKNSSCGSSAAINSATEWEDERLQTRGRLANISSSKLALALDKHLLPSPIPCQGHSPCSPRSYREGGQASVRTEVPHCVDKHTSNCWRKRMVCGWLP